MNFKNSTLLFISLTFVFIILFFYEINHIEYNSKPTPTEFITKKKNRKELKKSRKEWMENMHRSHPDDNWRLIDKQNRKINTDKVLSIRQQISRNTNQEKPNSESAMFNPLNNNVPVENKTNMVTNLNKPSNLDNRSEFNPPLLSSNSPSPMGSGGEFSTF